MLKSLCWRSKGGGMPLILMVEFSYIILFSTAMPYDKAIADDTLAQKQRALELITNTADRICGEAQTSGNIENSELAGKVEGQLKGLASKLAEAGISGSGKIANEQYQGVLRSDLASTLHDIRQCKLKILERLQDDVLGSSNQLQLAPDANNIHTLLENKNSNSQALKDFIDQRGLEQTYPLGFALYYSDRRQVLWSSTLNSNGITFDPSTVRVSYAGLDRICVNSLYVRIPPNRFMAMESNACFALGSKGGGYHPWLSISGVDIDLEPIASSAEGSAWVIGMRPSLR